MFLRLVKGGFEAIGRPRLGGWKAFPRLELDKRYIPIKQKGIYQLTKKVSTFLPERYIPFALKGIYLFYKLVYTFLVKWYIPFVFLKWVGWVREV